MKRIIVVLALLVVLAAALIILAAGRRDAGGEQLDVSDIRSSTTASTTDIDPGERPEPGVYVYRGKGEESIDLLGGQSHTYPDELAAEVTLDEDDTCRWHMRFRFLKGREKIDDLCTSDGDVHENGFTSIATFLNTREEDVFECSDASRWRATWKAGDTTSWECTSPHSTTKRVLTVGPDGDKFHVILNSTVTGKQVGKNRSEFWYDVDPETGAATGLPARIAGHSDYIAETKLGKTHYVETYDYTLDPDAM